MAKEDARPWWDEFRGKRDIATPAGWYLNKLPSGWRDYTPEQKRILRDDLEYMKERSAWYHFNVPDDSEVDKWISQIDTHEGTKRSTEALSEFKDTSRQFAERGEGRTQRFEDAYSKFAQEQRGYIGEGRGYWRQQRDKALSDWERDRDMALSALIDRKEDISSLRDIRDQQLGLASELRDAPSTVAEQARIEADRALEQNVAMAGAFGGSLASNFARFSGQAMRRQGDVLRDTSALRAQEYANRINQRANLLGRAGATSAGLAELGRGEASLLSNLGLQNYNVRTGLGKGNIDVDTALMGREAGILGGLGSVLGFGRAEDRLALGDESSIFGMTSGLEDREYNRFFTERAYADIKEREADQRRSGLFKGIATVGGSILGGLIGGPPGAMIGGSIGGGLSGGGGGGGISPIRNFLQQQAHGQEYTPLYPIDAGRPSFRNVFSRPTREAGNVGIGDLSFSMGG